MTSAACIKMWNRFINTNDWTGAVKYAIYVHYDTILTHTTQADAKPHPPYDDRIIARRAGMLLLHQSDTRTCKGPSQTSLQPFRLSMSVNSCQAQRAGSTATPPCASCWSGWHRLSAVGRVESTHRQPIASPNSAPLLQAGASGTCSSGGRPHCGWPTKEQPSATRTAELRLLMTLFCGENQGHIVLARIPHTISRDHRTPPGRP